MVRPCGMCVVCNVQHACGHIPGFMGTCVSMPVARVPCIHVCARVTCVQMCMHTCMCVSGHAGEQIQSQCQSLLSIQMFLSPLLGGREPGPGSTPHRSCHSNLRGLPLGSSSPSFMLDLSPHPGGKGGPVTHRNSVSSDFRPKRNQVEGAKA